MKFSLATITAIIAASAPVAMADDWKCNGSGWEGGLRRLSFKFKGYCEHESGRCFLRAIRGKGLVAQNWQAWKVEDGWWQVDVSTTAGLAWQVNNAIQDVTGEWRGCWPAQ
ncbi:uncharacterized protein B0J16DRAFT_387987 [Fusarium flagelliforme]|uniref:uncharacterized protein n=1 Tax=Fusarium flagelliforme TaxID=2675880 RepID=UPI001E8DF218|nr:uncharacterized protein B0J16DRAFT_387987 [Fusarium flagelliforme]KAH7174161.1 hypothetical protein B0J16DRAFT_387987 [Fusarium flagelliforme]